MWQLLIVSFFYKEQCRCHGEIVRESSYFFFHEYQEYFFSHTSYWGLDNEQTSAEMPNNCCSRVNRADPEQENTFLSLFSIYDILSNISTFYVMFTSGTNSNNNFLSFLKFMLLILHKFIYSPQFQVKQIQLDSLRTNQW